MGPPAGAFWVVVCLVTGGCLGALDGLVGEGSERPGQDALAWPPPADATVRPGASLTTSIGRCTLAFLLASPDNRTVYATTAAHCVVGRGGEVAIGPRGLGARVVYSSFETMNEWDEDDAEVRQANDLAILELSPEAVASAHPLMLGGHGPSSLASQGAVGDRVVSYGATPLRPRAQPVDERHGVIVETSSWYAKSYFVTPVLPGDSGSPVVLEASGAALGLMTNLQGTEGPTGSGRSVNLQVALDYATRHAAVEARVVEAPPT